ncbi:pyocin activator PrtN family protein [Pseudorhizobium flavum]|uniref:pyocin activator PrtN family protein n=1 Tax=Pseudorhizobium flavum TaxID=1335061 RepID=UPI002490E6BB|nr:pyocin activator PrtN family protein [Pseudorhizobium flavum]
MKLAEQISTASLLLAEHGGRTLIPLEEVCKQYFSHLTQEKLLRKVSRGELDLPVVRVEASQKCQKGVHILDLAEYLDSRREAAKKELRQLRG